KSPFPMQVNGINVINTKNDPIVDLIASGLLSLTFDILRSILPTFVDVESKNAASTPIRLNGLIENPLGTTRVRNEHGNIESKDSRPVGDGDPGALIRTNIVDLETPDGNIGSASPRVNVDEVDSAGVPMATGFISARVGGDGSIFLGRHQFFTGEVVQYNASGPALGGLVKGKYYVVLASSDDLSVKLAPINDPPHAIAV